MIALVLAAALVGPPAPQPPKPYAEPAFSAPTPFKRTVDHVWWIGLATLGDKESTRWGLRRCASCRELNQTLSDDVLLATFVGSAVTEYVLESNGNHKAAKWMRWVTVGGHALFIANNVFRGVRRK